MQNKKHLDVLGDYPLFLNTVFEALKQFGVDCNDLVQADHVCFRTSTPEEYSQKKQELSTVASLLGESRVNARPIATFRLQQPIIYKDWRIDLVELAAPKDSSKYSTGLEHIEFVLYDDFQTFMQKYSNLRFETKSIARGINPEIRLPLGEFSAKFHLLSLATVIYLEKKLGITSVQDKK